MKYSDIKRDINFNILKESNENLAYLTHFLHHQEETAVSPYYKTAAETYLSSMIDQPYPMPLNLDFAFPLLKSKKALLVGSALLIVAIFRAHNNYLSHSI